MDRKIVYPGAIPLETDLLQTNRFAMVGLAKLASAMMGSSTYLHGLECRPAQPASLHVTVAAGEIYSLQNVDGTAYSSLDADTHSILKQGILAGGVTLPLTAPNTAGFSVNYLVQVAYQDVDAESTVLPYYNASNPTQAWHGPNNSGSAQGTVRAGVCSVSIKAGVAATTGTQTTPGVDAGHVAAYVVAVKSGQTSITAADISVATHAPFLPTDGLVAGIQSGVMNYAPDHGHANAYAAAYSPPVTALVDGLKLTFKAKSANSGTSTFSPNGLAAAPIYSNVHVALKGGEILATGLVEVEWNSTLSAWVLVNTNLASISEGLVRTVNTHGPDANGNVKLGTAADADLGKDKLGQVLTVGNYGLQNALTALKDTNLDTLKTFGFYLISNATNAPLGDTSVWFLSVLSWDSKTSGDPYRVLQIADGYGTSGTMKNRSFRRTYSGTAAGWSAWIEFYSETHKPTAVDINAADVRNNFAAKMGVARVISGTNKPSSPGIWSVENSTWTPYPYGTLYVTTNNADLSATPGDNKFIHYLFIAHGAANKFYVATEVNSSFVGWESYLSKKGGTMTDEIKSTSANILRGIQGGHGAILRMDANGLYFLQTNKDDPNGNYNDRRSLTIANDTGAVGIGTQLTVTHADFINKVGYTTYKDGDGHDHYQVGGLRLEVDGSQMAELYYNVLADQSAEVSLHNKYGTTDSYLSLRNDGQLTIVGSNPQLYVGSSRVASDGNIQGAAWGGDWLSNYLNNNFVRGMQIGPRVTVWGSSSGSVPQGAVGITSETINDDRVNQIVYAYPMVNIGGNWVNAG